MARSTAFLFFALISIILSQDLSSIENLRAIDIKIKGQVITSEVVTQLGISALDATKAITIGYSEDTHTSLYNRLKNKEISLFFTTHEIKPDPEIPDLSVVPIFGIGISVIYNIPIESKEIYLSRDVLVDIFLGRITKWNDKRILEINPGFHNLDFTIKIIVNGCDLDGSTYIITEAFSKWSDEWRERFGAVGSFPQELVEQFGDNILITESDSLASQRLRETYFSIGFVSMSIDIVSQASTVKIINQYGIGVKPSVKTINPTFENPDFNEMNYSSTIDAPVENGYPITGFSYLVYRQQNTPPELCESFQITMWGFGTVFLAQSLIYVVEDSGIGVISDTQKRISTTTIRQATCNGIGIYDPVNNTNPYLFYVLPGITDPRMMPVPSDFSQLPSAIPVTDATTLNQTIIEILPEYSNLELFEEFDQQSIETYFDSVGDPITNPTQEYQFDNLDSDSTDDSNSLYTSRSSIIFLISILILFINNSNKNIFNIQYLLIGLVLCSAFTISPVYSQRYDYCGINDSYNPLKVLEGEENANLELSLMFPLTARGNTQSVVESGYARLAIVDANDQFSGNFAEINGNNQTEVGFTMFNTGSSLIKGLSSILLALESNNFAIVGTNTRILSEQAAAGANLIQVPVVSHATEAIEVIDNDIFPWFSSVVPKVTKEARALASICKFYGWGDFGRIAVIGETSYFGDVFLSEFEAAAKKLELDVQGYFVYLDNSENQLPIEFLLNIRDTRARVIVNFLNTNTMQRFLLAADELNMINDKYVWMCSSSCGNTDTFLVQSPLPDQEWLYLESEEVKKLANGLISIDLPGGNGELYDQFLQRWSKLSPLYWGGIVPVIPKYAPYAYDATMLCVRSIFDFYTNTTDTLHTQAYLERLRNTKFVGLTGLVDLHGSPERFPEYDITNYHNGTFYKVGRWVSGPDYFNSVDLLGKEDNYGITMKYKITFFDNTTNLPDLDVRNSFDYWDCPARKMKTDDTGKDIRLQAPTPDASHIASFYECDGFIDCYNMSDELNCSSSIPIAMIVLSVIIVIMLFIIVIFLTISCIFGLCIKRSIFTTSGLEFLWVICFASFFGLISVFSFYGQPSTIGCNFSLWLLTLTFGLLVITLTVKEFRVFYTFYFSMLKKPNPLIYFISIILLMIPIILILSLWTLIATIEADIDTVDGHQHYVCSSKGFAGQIAGYIFFVILCFYFLILIAISFVLIFVTRKIIVPYNENQLTSTSIYNIIIISIITIPLYFIMITNPVAQWVILSIAFIYCFSSTIFIHFFPKLFHLTTRTVSNKDFRSDKSDGSSNTVTEDSMESQNEIFK